MSMSYSLWYEHVLWPLLWHKYEHVSQPVLWACLMAFAMTQVWTYLTSCAISMSYGLCYDTGMSRSYCLCYEHVLLPVLWADFTTCAMSRSYCLCYEQVLLVLAVADSFFLCAMSLQLKQPPSPFSPLLFFPPSLIIRKVLCLNPYTHFHIVIQPPVSIYYMWSAAPYAREAVKKYVLLVVVIRVFIIINICYADNRDILCSVGNIDGNDGLP